MTDKQVFKVGFLLKCAEEGLTLEETHQRVKAAIQQHYMTKKAALPPILQPFGWAADKTVNVGTNLLKLLPSILSTGVIGGLGMPLAGGVGAGYLAAKLTSPDKHLIEDAKQDEITGEYERLAEEARRRARIKQLQNQTGRRIIALTPDNK